MLHADGRRRDRRRVSVAILTAAMTIAALLAAMAPARSAGRVAPRRAQAGHVVGNFDVRARSGAAVAPSARTARARVQLARRLGTQGVIQSDPLTGTLRMVGRLDGYLTARSARPARTVAMGFVRSNLAGFGLTRADIKTFHLRQDYVDIAGVHHISWTQSKRGVPVFHNGLRASVTSDGRLLNVTGSPVHGIRVASFVPSIGADDAIRAARLNGGTAVAGAQSSDSASLVLFPTGRGARLAWKTFTWPSTQQLYLSIVDAGTGSVLYRQSLTSDATGTATAWEFYPSDLVPAGGNTANPVAFPVVDGSRLINDNAHVWADVKDNNTPDPGEEIAAVSGTDWSVPAILDTTNAAQNCTTSRPCTWDKSVPFSWQANMAQNAAQVMYYLNKFHDHLAAAPYGFTAAAGNFEGDDKVLGQAMDGANSGSGLPDKDHFNNANMGTPPDGQSPTMQMYLFRSDQGLPALPSADGGDDAEVVYHEYTHGLSNRLVLYPDGTSGLTNQQGNSMGEGWSDWYALDFLNNLGFKPDAAAVGDVVMGAITFAGLLRTNPVDCPVGAASPCVGSLGAGSGGYTYGDFGKVFDGPEVHSDGEIWLETLWQIRQTLGPVVAETLVTRGMELSPGAPSFLDMRNSIIQADLVNFAGANAGTLWSIFAERGMGFFAASTSDDVHPIENFSPPPDCATSDCATISGKVKDKASGKPVAGIHVAVPGLDSGFASDLADTTDAAGRFSIANVPFGSYPRFSIAGAGYERILVGHLELDGDLKLAVKVIRDWASTEGGAKVGKFTPPDYSPFCGPDFAFDLDLGTGWGSDAVGSTAGSTNKGPRKVVVKLPKAVDVTSFAVASTGSCGDGPEAGVKKFKVETKTANAGWVMAFIGSAPNNGKLLTYVPKTGTANVRFVRFTMLTNHGDPLFMDVMEFSVRGT
ncbi:MAG: M36 family metallopeptidase [Actinomycetota bacterium]